MDEPSTKGASWAEKSPEVSEQGEQGHKVMVTSATNIPLGAAGKGTSREIPPMSRSKAGNRAGAAAWAEFKWSSMAQGQRVWLQCQVMLVRVIQAYYCPWGPGRFF